MRHRQVDRRAGPRTLADDRARHEVARREIAGRLVRAARTRSPASLTSRAAFAAQRLRQQEPRRARDAEHRRMELHELEVGHARAGLERHRDAVAGGDRRVRRLAKHLAGAAGREQRARGADRRCTSPSRSTNVAPDARAVVDVAATAPAHRRARCTRGCAATLLPQHAADLAAGGVARVQHAAHAVRGLAAERRAPVRVAIEGRAPLDQLAHVARTVVHEHVDRLGHAQAVAGGDACRARAAPANRRARPPRRCRPARSRCCSRADRPW